LNHSPESNQKQQESLAFKAFDEIVQVFSTTKLPQERMKSYEQQLRFGDFVQLNKDRRIPF